ncbi:MAG TPA: SDR family oxidoreductase [Planctomycetaceae bacterium]|nr:SDR family oxidoreductase [Planctomycetaceae bacterium]
MPAKSQTAIVTGASQGIGAGAVTAFLERGYRVVANSRNITKSGTFSASDNLALVDGDIGDPATAARIAETAVGRFGTIDVIVNNAGIFLSKPFLDYTADDFRSLVATNLEGFLYVTQLAIRQMLRQKVGGCVINLTTSLVEHPIAGHPAAVPMITKGGLKAVTRSLAIEYAKEGIRVNAVAPGTVDTPMHERDNKDHMKSLSPMGRIVSIRDIVDAIVYLAEAPCVTGEILHVDSGAHVGKW